MEIAKYVVFTIGILISTAQGYRKFPDSFKFGIATSAYQIEGAWNISDKSEQLWDHYTHRKPNLIKDGSNGDVACDSYHQYKRDVEMLVELGVDYYRFSISWSRLLPKGYGHEISKDGLQYYNNLINELLKYNITPMVTLHHWDTPQTLMEMGGWTNPLITDFFEDFARVAFESFGDRVKQWITFNEPYNMCLLGYGTIHGLVLLAPNKNIHGIGEYMCTHNVLRAHANAYHLYNNTYKSTQKGKVGLATVITWPVPETNSTEDKQIAEKALEFNCGWYLNPILSEEGDYPRVMREEIDRISKEQGFKHSRLPVFTAEEIKALKGSSDFIGINYYTAVIYRNDKRRPSRQVPSHENDLGYSYYQRDDWETGASEWLKLYPQGLRHSLNWIKKKYSNQEICITEMGISSKRVLKDLDRISFMHSHTNAVLDALDDGVNVTGLTMWSLMDNFEWSNGYTEPFGFYQVNFSHPEKTRTPRMSVLVYRQLIKMRYMDPEYLPEPEDIINKTKNNKYFNKLIIIILSVLSFAILIAVAVSIKYCVSFNNKKNKMHPVPKADEETSKFMSI